MMGEIKRPYHLRIVGDLRITEIECGVLLKLINTAGSGSLDTNSEKNTYQRVKRKLSDMRELLNSELANKVNQRLYSRNQQVAYEERCDRRAINDN
ncbi:MAG: hypothetical protein GY841_16550 [FCB group bacterium]|nr:hypothetical protein [FCB group bacterium]